MNNEQRKTKPPESAELLVSFTRFESPAPLSKSFSLEKGGGIVKTAAAQMTAGKAKGLALDFVQFGAELALASEKTAFGYGLHDAEAYGDSVQIAIAAKADPAKGILARSREFFDYRPGPGILMFDHDVSADGPTVTPDELLGILGAVCPAFAGAACWVRGSVSSGVYVEGGTPKPRRGFHAYFAAADALDIPRFGKALFKRLWLAGYGFIAISSAGSFLVRGLIDAAVFDGERLDFVGKPVVGEGLAYTPPQAVYHEGGYLDTLALPDLSEAEEKQFAALVAQAKTAREPDRQSQRARWEETHVRAMMGRGVAEPQARAQVRQIPADGRPGDLYRDWPLEFAQLGFATVGDVLANPSRYDGAALADPIEGISYGRTTAKFFANPGGKPYINSHAHGGCKYFLKPTTGPESLPEEPPFDLDYYAQYAPVSDEDGALLEFQPAPSPVPKRALAEQARPNPEKLGKQDAEQAGDGGESEVWGEPILFSSKTETPEIKPEWLPGIFGEYADRLSQNLQTPPALAVMSILSVLSAALARKVVIGPMREDAYAEPVNIWTLAVAESGERKSQILGRCTKPLVIWEKERTRLEKAEIEQAVSLRKVAERRADKLEADAAKEDDPARREELAKEAAALRAEQPEERHPTQVFTGDATPEAAQELLVKAGGRMAFISDEAGLLLVMAGVYGGGEAILDVFLQGYSGNDVRVNRRCRSAIIERPAVTLGLSIQPGILADFPLAAKRKFRASGLFARFFPVFPRSNIGRRDVRKRASVPEDLQRAYDKAVMDLLDFEPETEDGGPLRLNLDATALELWHGFAEEIELGQGEGGAYQDIRDWAAKLPGGVLRLAGLFHMARHGKQGASLPVGLESVSPAVGLALALIDHARAVFGLVGADKTTDDAKAVWGWIELSRFNGFLQSAAHNKFTTRFGKVEDLELALSVLKGRELVHGPFKSKPKGGRGRPTIGWTVNPAALR